MTNQINTNWNEFTKEMTEFSNKNLEVINKFWKTAIEQNQDIVAKNMETYFNYLNGSVNHLNTMWNTYSKESDEFRKAYAERMDTMYKNFTTIYRETIEKATTPQTKQA